MSREKSVTLLLEPLDVILRTDEFLFILKRMALDIYLFIVIYLDWVGPLQFNMYSTLAPVILI